MSAGWVAGVVRARGMVSGLAGATGAHDLAAAESLAAALTHLHGTVYGDRAAGCGTLAEAQRAVADTALWNVRVLAGWLPPAGAHLVRALVAGVEAANVSANVSAASRRPAAGDGEWIPYDLGTLGSVPARVDLSGGPAALRSALRASWWGDPGSDDPRAIRLWLAAAHARRVVAAAPSAASWARSGAALLVAREVVVGGRTLPAAVTGALAQVIGRAAPSATTLPDLLGALPGDARAALAGAGSPAGLWLAEARWWRRLGADADAMLRAARPGPAAVTGAVASLAADAWRVRGALESAARGGQAAEVFDAAS